VEAFEASAGEQTGTADVLLVLTDTLNSQMLDWIREFRRAGHQPAVVLVAEHADAELLARAVEMGTTTLLPRRGTDYSRLVPALVAAADVAMVPTSRASVRARAAELLTEMRAQGSAATPVLQDREIEVLRLVAAGYDTAEIAAAPSFSERTIKNSSIPSPAD
jgi:DNA-binding NarL/FixJ family response regulator